MVRLLVHVVHMLPPHVILDLLTLLCTMLVSIELLVQLVLIIMSLVIHAVVLLSVYMFKSLVVEEIILDQLTVQLKFHQSYLQL